MTRYTREPSGHRSKLLSTVKIVAIDVDSGSYADADTVVAASERLRSQRPDADIWCVRVGYRGYAALGAGLPLRSGPSHVDPREEPPRL